jgi:hypothetical protein
MHVRSHTLGHPGYIEPYALNDPQGHFLNSYWKCAWLLAANAPSTAQDETGAYADVC